MEIINSDPESSENTQGNYSVDVQVAYPERSSRLLALATLLFLIPKIIMLIPHFMVLWLLGMVAFFVWILGQFAVLFTGRYPKSFFDFLVGITRWNVRVNAYVYGLVDKYPPFSLDR
jgi:hypothetical protein